MRGEIMAYLHVFSTNHVGLCGVTLKNKMYVKINNAYKTVILHMSVNHVYIAVHTVYGGGKLLILPIWTSTWGIYCEDFCLEEKDVIMAKSHVKENARKSGFPAKMRMNEALCLIQYGSADDVRWNTQRVIYWKRRCNQSPQLPTPAWCDAWRLERCTSVVSSGNNFPGGRGPVCPSLSGARRDLPSWMWVQSVHPLAVKVHMSDRSASCLVSAVRFTKLMLLKS